MLGTGGNVSGLIGEEKNILFTTNNAGSTGYYNPVLTAVVVHLKTQAMSGFDFDSLDLVAGRFFKDCERTPGS